MARMRLIVDENVPDSVARYLAERGHEVELVRERFGSMTPDEFIAWVGDANDAVVVTLDHDFDQIVRRVPEGGKTRFRRLGRISLRCAEPRALSRIIEFIDDIEREYDRCRAMPDQRMIVRITEITFMINR